MLNQPIFAALKQRLADVPGIDRMSMTNVAGRLVFGGGDGRIAAVQAGADDATIDAAIRHTFGGSPPATATTPQPKGTAMSITGAAPATLSIKAMIESSRQKVKGAHDKLIANAGKVSDAADALDGLGDDLGKEADDLLSMVGQYKNDLGAG